MPENLGWTKKSNILPILWLFVQIKSSMKQCLREKKFIFYPRMSQQKTNFNQNQKKIGLQKAYVWVHPNSGCWSQIAWFFLQNVHLITKIKWLPEKNLLTSLQTEMKGGGGQPLSLGKRPSLLRVNTVKAIYNYKVILILQHPSTRSRIIH